MAHTFRLHPRLEQDCIKIGRFELCHLLMMNDQNYPWFILVPEKADVREIYQLNSAERLLLSDESCYLAAQLAQIYQADKMNIAAIGNLVPQLHLHHIVRYQSDLAWPAPVWGFAPANPYHSEQIQKHIDMLKQQLTQCRFESNPND